MNRRLFAGMFLVLAVISGCGPTAETPRPEPAPTLVSREEVYLAGHQLYLESQYDSAAVLLRRAYKMDTSVVEPVRDLAQLHYEWAMRAPEKSRERTQRLRTARAYFVRLDALGDRTSDVYERLCEISVGLNDDGSFVRFARKNAELYPYDRQLFNLARAYFEVEDFQSVIKSTKESIDRFKSSPYITSYYRLLGRAYMKIGRDQTAEKTLAAGVKEAEARLAALRTRGAGEGTDQRRRAHDDKINMLLALKQLHTTYRADEKLGRVEQQLKEEGYGK